MADSSSKIPIIVAIVGLVGVLGAAVINNWDKISGRTPPDTTRTTSPAGPTTSTAGTTTPGGPTGSTTPGTTTTPGGQDVPPGRPGSACAAPSASPGDEILDFHVVSLQGTKIVVKANYHISPSHERVMIGAWLQPNGSGYVPTFTPPLADGNGGAELAMDATPGQSDRIQIFLYEEGRPSEPFACWVFPYRMSFADALPPGAVSKQLSPAVKSQLYKKLHP